MVVDTSALIAIVIGEEERAIFEELILRTPVVVMSVVSAVEACIVLSSKRPSYDTKVLDETISSLHIDIRPVDLNQGSLARTAFLQHGRGRGPAKLNFGDCFAYALAKARDDNLL